MGATLLPLNLTASLCVTYSPDFRRRNECSARGVPECNRVTVCNLFSPDYRRRNECSAGGVPECNRVPGCCPEKYDALYGDVAFGEGE